MITKQQQTVIWNTKTLLEFSHLNYDGLLFPSNIVDTETYIAVGDKDNRKHIEGFEVRKKHKRNKTETVYFVRTEDIKKMQLEIIETRKVHYCRKVYELVTKSIPKKIVPHKEFTWRELVDSSGLPTHTNSLHYTLYKMKVLYARLMGQFYFRVITKSRFGKDKYIESVNSLLDKCSILADPTLAKLYYSACYNNLIVVCELPQLSGEEFNRICNQFMRIGDKTNKLDNRARSKNGSAESTYTDKLSTIFIHNVPEYYHKKGKKCFDDLYPFNVTSRYFYTLYDGNLQAGFPQNMNHRRLAQDNEDYIRDWIKSALWYEENWPSIDNKFPEILLEKFEFHKDSRFGEYMTDFSRCCAEYAEGDVKLYLQLLHEEYKCHKDYEAILKESNNDEDNFVWKEPETIVHNEIKAKTKIIGEK